MFSTDLTDGTLRAPILIGADGNPVAPPVGEPYLRVCTAVGPDGKFIAGADTCVDWTSNSASDYGATGEPAATDRFWTDNESVATCEHDSAENQSVPVFSNYFYCFEQ